MDGWERLWMRSNASRRSSSGIQGLGVPVLVSQAIRVPSSRGTSVIDVLEFLIGIGGLANWSSLSFAGSSPTAMVHFFSSCCFGGVLVVLSIDGCCLVGVGVSIPLDAVAEVGVPRLDWRYEWESRKSAPRTALGTSATINVQGQVTP